MKYASYPLGTDKHLPLPIQTLTKVLDAAVGIKLVDDPEANQYPMPLTATGKSDVEVRRLCLIFSDHTRFYLLRPVIPPS